MDFTQIDTFIRVIRLGSFIGAATRLKISQPTVTMRVRALENELGIALINMTGKRITPTPAGKLFYNYALRMSRTLKFGLDHITDSSEESIVLAGTPAISTYLLPPIYEHWIGEHPESNIIIQSYDAEKVLEAILDQMADIGVIHGDIQHPGIDKLFLYREEFVLTMHPDHPLSFKKSINLHEFKRQTLIDYHKDSPEARMIEHMFSNTKIEPKMTIYSVDVITIKRMVLENVGLAFLPRIVVHRELAERRLIHKPIEQSYDLGQICQMITLKSSYQKEKITRWKENIIHYLQKSGLSLK